MSDNLSPCIGRCRLNDESVCEGCFRSLDEIRDWRLRTLEEQRKILRDVAERRASKLQPSPLDVLA